MEKKEIRLKFFNETNGQTWLNSQNEPDIDYVFWLEKSLSEANEKFKEMEWNLISENKYPELILHNNTASEFVLGVIDYNGKIYVDRVAMYDQFVGIEKYFIDADGEFVNVIKWKPMPKP